MSQRIGISLAALVLLAASAPSQDVTEQDVTEAKSKKEGTQFQSIGPLAFGPNHVLFVADAQAATIYAFSVADQKEKGLTPKDKIEGIDGKIAAMLGTEPREVRIRDVAVNPATGQVYLAIVRGRGADATPLLLRVDQGGEIKEVALDGVEMTKVVLENAPPVQPANREGGQGRQGRQGRRGRRGRNRRMESITDLAYVDGKVIVAGLSNEEFASKLRTIPYPFKKSDNGCSVEIFHGAHGQLETRSPVRTFVPYDIEGETHVVAAYTCTPLVVFPLADLKPAAQIRGRTIAELGNRNRPLDMIAYKKDGKGFLLLANNSRGVMKIPTKGIAEASHIEERIGGGGTAGMPYDKILNMKGVLQLDKLDAKHGVVLVRTEEGELNLQVVLLP